MSKITFTTKEIKILQKNTNVQRASSLAISKGPSPLQVREGHRQ
ncbi:hypothetical protein [Mesobacillus zeae]|nr:hypothetical protein [Mesobacillus zeae]